MDRWTVELDALTDQFESEFGQLSFEQLNWKPNPEVWSIGQNIDHLITINSSYFPLLEAARAGSLSLPWTSRIGFLVSFFGKTILNASSPDRRKKIKTFPIWEATTSEVPADILDQFREHQEKLKKEIIASEGLIGKQAILFSPANRNIVYRLETAFDIIVAHEERHLEQAKEIAAQR